MPCLEENSSDHLWPQLGDLGDCSCICVAFCATLSEYIHVQNRN